MNISGEFVFEQNLLLRSTKDESFFEACPNFFDVLPFQWFIRFISQALPQPFATWASTVCDFHGPFGWQGTQRSLLNTRNGRTLLMFGSSRGCSGPD